MIRHVILFNATRSPELVRAMAERAKHILGSIPGVTDIRFGTTVGAASHYAYLLDIGLADLQALERYRTHPVHVRFADEEFRPLAPDRVTTDYSVE